MGGQMSYEEQLEEWKRNKAYHARNYEKIWQDYVANREEIDAKIEAGGSSQMNIFQACEIAKAAIYLEIPEQKEHIDRAVSLGLESTSSYDKLSPLVFLIAPLLNVGSFELAIETRQQFPESLPGMESNLLSITDGHIAKAIGDYEAEESFKLQYEEMVQRIFGDKDGGIGKKLASGDNLSRLAYLQAMQGKWEEANANLDKALVLAAELGISKPPVDNLGLSSAESKNHEVALNATRASIRVQTDMQVLWMTFQFIETCLLLSRHEEAKQFANEGLALADLEWIQSLKDFWKTFALAGRVHFEIGEADAAIRHYERALTEARKPVDETHLTRSENHPEIIAIKEGLAWALLLAGDESAGDEALAIREAQLDLVERLFRYSSQRQRLSYLQSLDPFSLLVETGQHEALAETILRFKGSVLDSVLEDRKIAEQTSDPALAETARKLRLAKRLAFDAAWNNDPNTAELEDSVQTLEAELASAFRNNATARSALSVTTDEVQERLNEKDRLAEFIRHRTLKPEGGTEARYGVMIYSRDESPKWVSLTDAKLVDESILILQEAMSLQRKITEEDLSALLNSLYESLLAPLETHVPDGTRLIISPDGNLSCLSFATLLDNDQQFAADRWTLCYVSTGRDLLRDSTMPAGQLELRVFANPNFTNSVEDSAAGGSLRAATVPFALEFSEIPPLPGTKKELERIEEISRENGWELVSFEGSSATESAVKDWNIAPSILHFATHGMFLERQGAVAAASQSSEKSIQSARFDNPLIRAILTLTGAQTTFQQWGQERLPNPENDGILTAEEISLLDLEDTWLATLSACDTASGKSLEGQGVMGLRRGFFLAGVDHLVMTFWPISDEGTVSFIDSFYRALPEQSHPGIALANTQREALSQIREESGLRMAVMIAGPFAASVSGPLPAE